MEVDKATEADLPEIEAFLLGHVETSMFPVRNLRDHGLGSDAPRAMRFWKLVESGRIRGVVGLNNQGMLMPQCPQLAQNHVAEIKAALAGSEIRGIIGEAGQSRMLEDAFISAGAETTLNHDEESFSLDLRNLDLSESPGASLEPMSDKDRDMLICWRSDYHREAIGTPTDQIPERATVDVDGNMEAGSHRILKVDGQPVATTGFNATLDDIVQIGGVYTPPEHRSKGYARLAVAMHLAEARASSVERAFLFSSSAAATKAYRAIGFQPFGQFTLILYRDPQKVPA